MQNKAARKCLQRGGGYFIFSPMNWLSTSIEILALSQLVTLALYFQIHHKGNIARLMSLFSLCLIAYLLNSLLADYSSPLASYILNRLVTITPFVLWLIAFNLFVDSERIHRGIWIAMAAFVVVRAVGIPLYDPTSSQSGFWFVVVYFVPQLILLGFSIHAIYLAIKGYSLDLIEQRRRARLFWVVSMGVLLSVVVGNTFFSFVDPFLDQYQIFTLSPLPSANIVFPLYIFLITLAFNLTVFNLQPDTFLLAPPPLKIDDSQQAANKPSRNADPAVLAKIKKLMEEDRLYAKMGLTITQLAEALSMQEYLLRKLINQQLNYRNFNQFLNNYRINEACKKLKDTRSPISSIALDVGYGSLSSFNKAFKDRYNITPSDFRNLEQLEPNTDEVSSQ